MMIHRYLHRAFAALAVVVTMACSVADMNAVTRRALIIGLGEQQDPAWGKVNGDNDVPMMSKLLRSAGYRDITTLVNRKATKIAIVSEFKKLAARCKPGDAVYIHFSGHGQLMTDLDGDEAMKWTGRHAGYDEAWIPYDAYMRYCPEDRGDSHLCDDEVALMLTDIRRKIGDKGSLMVVIDSCHSGDSTSAEPPSDDDDDDVEEVYRGVYTKFEIPGNRVPGKSPSAEQWLTVSACRPDQLCAEMKGRNAGKLTCALLSIGKSFLKMSPEQLRQALDKFFNENPGRLPQHPMVTGAR